MRKSYFVFRYLGGCFPKRTSTSILIPETYNIQSHCESTSSSDGKATLPDGLMFVKENIIFTLWNMKLSSKSWKFPFALTKNCPTQIWSLLRLSNLSEINESPTIWGTWSRIFLFSSITCNTMFMSEIKTKKNSVNHLK